MEDKISIILEAVERAKGVLNKTIADIEKLDAANKKTESTWKRLAGALQEHDKLLLSVKVGAAAVVAATVLMARQAIITAESYLVMAQAAGTTVEQFSTLVFAAKQANVEVNELAIGMKQLQIAAVNASQGAADQAAAFAALKVNIRNADGSLKTSTQLLFEVADAFSKAADGPVKAAIAQRLFGRSSQELIGFLNEGSAAIKANQEQAKKLGLEISTNTARAADQFSDNMNILKGILQGMANALVAQLLPVLLEVQKFFIENPTLVKVLTVALVALSAAIVAATVAWKAYTVASSIATATMSAEALAAAKAYLATITAISATSFIAYTAGIAGAVAIIYAGVEAWRAYKAAQEEAVTHANLESAQERISRALIRNIVEMKRLGQVTEEEAKGMKRHLEDSLAHGSDKEISETQQLVRNRIRILRGQDAIHPGEAPAGAAAAGAAGSGKPELVLPDVGLEKARVDANTKLFEASIANREQDFQNSLKAEQTALDDALRRRTISVEEWRKQQQALDEKSVAEARKIEDMKFSIQKENLTKTLALSQDPKEKAALNGEIEALEIAHEGRMDNIAAEAAATRLATDRKYFDNRASLVEEAIQVANTREAAAGASFQEQLDAIQIGEQRGEFVNVFEEINRAKDEYLQKLQDEQDALSAILTEMEAINAQQPGTFAEKDKAKVSKAIEDNQKEQVKAEQRTVETRRGLQAKQLQGTQDMFANMATAAKAFGKEGFAAYKALAIASAVVNTASAAIGAYQSVVGIPYVGPILAPIAAAAAIAAGAAQISIIAAEKYAGGGLISGPGSGTSDEVPILASNREFMVRNAVVEQPGALEFLRNFNMMGMDAIETEVIPTAPRSSRFATGGLIGDAIESARSRNQDSGGVSNVAFLNSRNQQRRFMRQEGAKIVVDEMRHRGNQVVA